MKVARSPVTAVMALALGAIAHTAHANPIGAETKILNTLTRISTQYGLIVLRTLVDLTYEHLAVDPRTGDVILTELTVYPPMPWSQEAPCKVVFGRIIRSDEIGFEVIDSRFEISGMTISQSCFEPEQGAMMTAFGYDGLTIDSLSMNVSYEFASSAAELSVRAAVKDAAAITLTAAFDYVWITVPAFGPAWMGDEPRPVALLSEAEVSIENRGLYERLEPMLSAQLGDLSAAPQMIEATLMQGLSEGGTREPSEVERGFVQNLAGEVGRFVAEKNRIVLSVAPSDGVWLDQRLFETPATAIAALQPRASLAPLVSRSLVSPSELREAISGQAAGMDDAAALRVGGALLSGIGAPRSVAHGRALLIPLAERWHAGAALLLAEAMDAEGETAMAYRMALRAAAGGESRALAVADRIEDQLGAEVVLGVQAEAAESWPGAAAHAATGEALVSTADIGAIGERAQNAALGRDGPRNYAEAYYWASLAAAAGDRSSAGLRERLDRRFAGAEGPDREAWKGVSQDAATQAIQTWTEGGLGARVAAMFGVAQ